MINRFLLFSGGTNQIEEKFFGLDLLINGKLPITFRFVNEFRIISDKLYVWYCSVNGKIAQNSAKKFVSNFNFYVLEPILSGRFFRTLEKGHF